MSCIYMYIRVHVHAVHCIHMYMYIHVHAVLHTHVHFVPIVTHLKPFSVRCCGGTLCNFSVNIFLSVSGSMSGSSDTSYMYMYIVHVIHYNTCIYISFGTLYVCAGNVHSVHAPVNTTSK